MRIWVTRDEASDGPLSTALREVGLTPVLEPVLERRVVDDCAKVVAQLGPRDWLVITSPYAAREVAIDPSFTANVAAVGTATAFEVGQRGVDVMLVGEAGVDALFEMVIERARGRTVVYPRSNLATPPSLPADIRLIDPILYETAQRAWRREVVDEIDIVSVASPSAVRATGPVDRPFGSIGPSTSAALREIEIEPWVQAPEPSFVSLARAIADQVDASRNQRA
jgi:uroporphyrinogen-III synthase